jgi:hypothetical protein
MTDNIVRGQQAAQELTHRWMATMQSIAHQIQRQQQIFQQASLQSMELAQQQQETFQQMSQQWMEQAQQQQQAFEQMIQESYYTYMDLLKPSR